MAATAEMALVSGQEFCLFEELCKTIKEWEKKNFVTLYTTSSQSIEAAKRRAPNRTLLDKLKFSELDYACVHGGREYKSKATQRRPCQNVVYSCNKVLDGPIAYCFLLAGIQTVEYLFLLLEFLGYSCRTRSGQQCQTRE